MFPQVTINLATENFKTRNIDQKIQDIIDDANPFPSPNIPALEWDPSREVEKPTPPSQQQPTYGASSASAVQQIATSTPIQQDKSPKEPTTDVLAAIAASVSKNTKLAEENLTNITAVLDNSPQQDRISGGTVKKLHPSEQTST